jgi:hypothetical protein
LSAGVKHHDEVSLLTFLSFLFWDMLFVLYVCAAFPEFLLSLCVFHIPFCFDGLVLLLEKTLRILLYWVLRRCLTFQIFFSLSLPPSLTSTPPSLQAPLGLCLYLSLNLFTFLKSLF